MTIFELKWGLVAGSFNPLTNEGIPIPHDQVLARLQVANVGLFAVARGGFTRRPNYAIVQQTQQKPTESVMEFSARMREVFKANSGLTENHAPDSAFQQQLKMAIMGGLQTPIRDWLTKNYVALPTCSPSDFMTHAAHAERVVRERKQKRASQILLSEQGETYVIETRKKKTFKGKERYNKTDSDQKSKHMRDGLCFNCHKKGHLYRDCKSKKENRELDREEEGEWEPKKRKGDSA